ncbi:hypothetical protein FA95DRAFT_591439 [Auriscalpium vulgare]|uniref:Uncharacterized protein n=1 Tax=Auriscalpium vulgare TaxID=40419 RepID=A0ACB8RE14_9AGAM|nr:hypothetical protein FA95DRAFT_591439 [Auriscalpium vulgare]
MRRSGFVLVCEAMEERVDGVRASDCLWTGASAMTQRPIWIGALVLPVDILCSVDGSDYVRWRWEVCWLTLRSNAGSIDECVNCERARGCGRRTVGVSCGGAMTRGLQRVLRGVSATWGLLRGCMMAWESLATMLGSPAEALDAAIPPARVSQCLTCPSRPAQICKYGHARIHVA